MIKGICHSFLIPQLDKVVMINVKDEKCFGSQDLPHPCGFQLLAASHDSEDLLTYCFDADLPLLALKGRDLFCCVGGWCDVSWKVAENTNLPGCSISNLPWDLVVWERDDRSRMILSSLVPKEKANRIQRDTLKLTAKAAENRLSYKNHLPTMDFQVLC